MGIFTPFAYMSSKLEVLSEFVIRTDGNSGSLQLAIPGTLATELGMTQFSNDISAEIRGTGSNKTLITGSISENTTQVKFPSDGYDSSLETTDRIFNTDTTDFEFGGGNFTIELWLNLSNASTNLAFFWKYVPGSVANSEMFFDLQNGRLRFAIDGQGGEDFKQTDVLSWSANVWYHICLQRQGNNFRMTRDGVAPGNGTATFTRTLNTTATPAELLRSPSSAARVQDFRIYKGVAKYGGNNFTPPNSMIFKS